MVEVCQCVEFSVVRACGLVLLRIIVGEAIVLTVVDKRQKLVYIVRVSKDTVKVGRTSVCLVEELID